MIDAIILAAGQSRRMGKQKLLLPFAGQTVIGHIVDQLLESPVRTVLVVAPRDDHAIRAALSERAVIFAENPDPNGDMLSSVRTGLRAIADDVSAALIVLGDQPSISPNLIQAMVEARQSGDRAIVAPVHRGKRGHPLLLAANYFEELLTHHDGAGLRGLLAAHGDDIFELAVSDEGVLMDMDYPEDYQRELARLQKMQ